MSQIGDHARTDTATANATNLMNLNILDWISSPKKFSRGQNLPYHLKVVKRFLTNIKAPEDYHLAILINSLDEECQLELFAHPSYSEEDGFQKVCDLMVSIFDGKKAELAKLMHLLELRQDPQETLAQFLARIRVRAFKLMGDDSRSQNEQYVLSAFINGVRNKAAARAIETMKPGSSEDALKMAKEAEKTEKISGKEANADCFEFAYEGDKKLCSHCGRSDKSELSEVKKQIQFLIQQMTYLTNKLNFRDKEYRAPQIRTRTYADAVNNRNDSRQVRASGLREREANRQGLLAKERDRQGLAFGYRCWNCNGDHLLRHCTKKLLCRKCNMIGHVSRFCNSNAIRYLHEEMPMRTECENGGGEFDSASCDLTSVGDSGGSVEDIPPAVMTVELGDEGSNSKTAEEWHKPRQKRQKRRQLRIEDREIEAWIKYIDGQTNEMPEGAHNEAFNRASGSGRCNQQEFRHRRSWRRQMGRQAPTLISNSRSEVARNKPLVMGKCGSSVTPILIDSGAGLNVIDEGFVESLPVESIVRRDDWESKIRCANDEVVRCRGRVTMSVRIGSFSEEMTFSVMPNLFPRVIIGLRQMKHSKMVIDPPNDSLWIGKEKVSFISRTEALVKVNV